MKIESNTCNEAMTLVITTKNIVGEISGNVIVNVKDSRVAVSKEMASKIMV